MSKFAPTPEQQQLLTYFQTGRSLKAEACAGSGKTSTLLLMAKATTKKCLYIAFNRAIKEEANSKFPKHVECKTSHGLAWSQRRIYHYRVGTRFTPQLLTDTFDLPKKLDGFSTNKVMSKVLQAINQFCLSADDEVGLEHVPPYKMKDEKQPAFEALLKEYLPKTWALMLDPESEFPVTHDFYLKVWALTKPDTDAEIVFFDEAQDANPLLLGLIERWRSQGVQVVFVGDRYQQIYSWRGAVNAMEQIQTPYAGALTRSFRYGPAIAELANDVLIKQREVHSQIEGHTIESQLVENMSQPDAFLCRTNACVIDELVKLLREDVIVAISGGVKELLYMIWGARDLMAYRPTLCRELRNFDSWFEVLDYVETEAELGQDLKPFIRLVDQYGLDDLEYLVRKVEHNTVEDADVVLATAHKSKGLEFDRVKLAGDFYTKYSDNDELTPMWSDEEAHLLYVAVTRAVRELDIGSCEAVREAQALMEPEALETPVIETTSVEPPAQQMCEESSDQLIRFAARKNTTVGGALYLLLVSFEKVNGLGRVYSVGVDQSRDKVCEEVLCRVASAHRIRLDDVMPLLLNTYEHETTQAPQASLF